MEQLRQWVEEEIQNLEIQLKVGIEEGHFCSIYGMDTENRLNARLAAMKDVLGWMPDKEEKANAG